NKESLKAVGRKSPARPDAGGCGWWGVDTVRATGSAVGGFAGQQSLEPLQSERQRAIFGVQRGNGVEQPAIEDLLAREGFVDDRLQRQSEALLGGDHRAAELAVRLRWKPLRGVGVFRERSQQLLDRGQRFSGWPRRGAVRFPEGRLVRARANPAPDFGREGLEV